MRARRQRKLLRQEIARAAVLQGSSFTEIECALILDRSIRLERLVLWLSLSFRVVSYDDDGTERVTYNTPTFPKAYPWGETMPEAQEMARLFHEVVGPPTPAPKL